MLNSLPPSQPQCHRGGDDREPTQERDPVATAGHRKGLGRTVEIPLEQRREGAKAEGFVDGRRLEGVGHRRRMAEGNRYNKGRDARRA